MHKDELLQLFTKEQRREITYPGYLREESGRIIRQVSLNDDDGYVIYSDLTEDLVEEAIVEQTLYYKKLGQRFEWKVYDYDKPADLKERLQLHGFKIGELETMMVLPLNADNPLLSCIIPSNIRQVTNESEIDEIMLLEEAIWGISHAEVGASLKRELLDNDKYLQIFAAYDHDKMVSAAWINFHYGTSFSSIWGGSTLPDYRNKGLYTLLLAARAQAAWREGFHLLTVDASLMSRPILEKKGFKILAYTWPCLSPEN